MTGDPTAGLGGRNLDEACAKAMGWMPPSTRGRCDVCGWPLVSDGVSGCWLSNCSMRPPPERRADAIAAYSSDPATLDEKLAWLAVRGRLSLSQHSYNNGWHACLWLGVKPDDLYVKRVELNCDGALHETIAQLVVKVAAARSAP